MIQRTARPHSLPWGKAGAVALAVWALAALPLAARAQTTTTTQTGGQIPITLTNTNYSNLSNYDCVNSGSTLVTFSWQLTWASGQAAEYVLSPNESCYTGTSGGTLAVTTTPNTSLSSANVEGITSLAEPSDSLTTYSDNTTNLTFAGIWDYQTKSTDSSVQVLYDSAPSPANCPTGVSTSVYLCVVANTGTSSTTTTSTIESGWVLFNLESKVPDAPTNVTVAAYDSELGVSWDAVSTPVIAAYYTVHVRLPNATTDVGSATVSNGQTNATVSGLTNGVTYNVFVVALDDAGSNPPTTSNVSLDSSVVQGTPVPSLSFFQEYKYDGGKEEGGCSGAGASTWALLLLPLLFLWRRKPYPVRAFGAATLSPWERVTSRPKGWPRRRRGRDRVLLLFLATLLCATAARADDKDEKLDDDTTNVAPVVRKASHEWARIELFTGFYSPNPDSEPGLSGQPYSQIFTQKLPLLTRLQIHMNVWDGYGHLSLGLSAGVWQINGHSLKLDHVTPAADPEALTLYPFGPILGYRADWVFTRYGVPLVPYVKLGYGVLYFTDTKDGKVTTGTINGQTWHSWGWAGGVEPAAGLEFPLDFLDQQRAANLDEDFGINSTGIFVEYGYDDWRGYNGGLRLNASEYSAGLYLAF